MSMREYCTKMYGTYMPSSALSYKEDLLGAFLTKHRECLSEPLWSSVGPDMDMDGLMDLVNEYGGSDGSYAGVASVVSDVVNGEQWMSDAVPIVPVSAADGYDGYAGIGVVPEEVYPWTMRDGLFGESRGLTPERVDAELGPYLSELGIERPSFWYIDVVQYG